jgi:hypothetical protein
MVIQTNLYLFLPFVRKLPFRELDKKNEAKKIKTSPASLKKRAFEKLKSSKLLPAVVNRSIFTLFSLVFWFTGRGQSLANCEQFNIFYLFILKIYHMHYIFVLSTANDYCRRL